MNNPNSLNIINAIGSGLHDQDLDKIYEAVRDRRERNKDLKAAQLRNQVQRGQSLWFTDTVRPNYLVGQEVEVVEVNRVRIVVKLKNPGSGGRFQGRINCQPSILVSVKPPYAVS